MITPNIGTAVKLNKRTAIVRKATSGCEGCIFKADEGAISCAYTTLCFAHCRKDRESVIFTTPY